MEQVKMNGVVIRQPDEDLAWNWETTSTEDSQRSYKGVLHDTPLFTVEQLGYKATNVTEAEMSQILQTIAKGQTFTLHYHSPYYGCWRDAPFRVGKGTATIGYYDHDAGVYSELSFNMTGVMPLD